MLTLSYGVVPWHESERTLFCSSQIHVLCCQQMNSTSPKNMYRTTYLYMQSSLFSPLSLAVLITHF